MAVLRNNILTDPQARQDYIDGVRALKREFAPDWPISNYDRLVYWHYRAMMTATPRGNFDGRNAAHIGPVFLPWHRMFLNRLEEEIQRVLGKPDFGLPYWDWAADGDLDDPGASALWADDCMGPAGFPVVLGPFRFDEENPRDPDNWRVRISDDIFTAGPTVFLLDRGLNRELRQDVMPRSQDVPVELAKTEYDGSPWSRFRPTSFRCGLEFVLHNTVHRWVAGDMATACSPNDPVFFLHHCNVDRIWASWQKQHGFPLYVPGVDESADLFRHRITDPMFPYTRDDEPITVEDVLLFQDRFEYDRYDALPVPEPEPLPVPEPEPVPVTPPEPGPEPQPQPPVG